MLTYDFTLILDKETSDEDEERLFELFEGDVTPGLQHGVPVLGCTIRAETLERAISETVATLADAGFSVLRIEIEPENYAFDDGAEPARLAS